MPNILLAGVFAVENLTVICKLGNSGKYAGKQAEMLKNRIYDRILSWDQLDLQKNKHARDSKFSEVSAQAGFARFPANH